MKLASDQVAAVQKRASGRLVNGGVKAACNVILSDWQARQATPAPAAPAAPAPEPAPAADSAPAAAPAAPAPEPVPAANSTPALAPASAGPASAPTPAVYQQQDSVRVQTATQTTSETISQESLGDAARKAKQHKACLDLAKDNPSIICK